MRSFGCTSECWACEHEYGDENNAVRWEFHIGLYALGAVRTAGDGIRAATPISDLVAEREGSKLYAHITELIATTESAKGNAFSYAKYHFSGKGGAVVKYVSQYTAMKND